MQATGEAAGTILIVDDDYVSRRFLQVVLSRVGHTIHSAESVPDAKRVIQQHGLGQIDCVVTDYRMPEETGLDLVEWLKQQDPGLAIVMVTAEGEKRLIAESMRSGVQDFLDKPIDGEKLRTSVGRAVELTRRQRHLTETEEAVQQVGQAQHLMMTPGGRADQTRVISCLIPKHQAGGDFINVHTLGNDQLLVVAADVSGHDLKAAFISSYFQGILRGMTVKGAGILEILEFFNRFLIEEWNNADPDGKGCITSLCVGAAVVDIPKRQVSVWATGFPSPLMVDDEGICRTTARPEAPLGWFEDSRYVESRMNWCERGYLLLWSDGLVDHAQDLEICPTALAYRLMQTTDEEEKQRIVGSAKDDISLVRIDLRADQNGGAGFHPILVESYPGDAFSKVDELQVGWERSLQYALPGLDPHDLYDPLLVIREAVLNGLKHGCRLASDQHCELQVVYDPAECILRARVSDSGEGYADDFLMKPTTDFEVGDRHYGLVLLREVPSRIKVERSGACLVFDFDLKDKSGRQDSPIRGAA